MYARVVMLTGVSDIEAAVDYLKETALPVVQSQRGYKGVSAAADRSGGLLGVLSLWETAADRDASESALAKVRQDALNNLASDMTVETLDQLAVHINKAPAVGCAVAVLRISMDPSRVAENAEYFNQEVRPRVSQLAGLRSIRQLVNPSTGEGMVSSIWDDEQSRQAGLQASQAIRDEIAATRGITIGERILAEVAFLDLK